MVMMSSKSKEFSKNAAIAAVARELSYPISSLKVDTSLLVASYDGETKITTSHQVLSGSSPLSIMVHRDREAAELVCCRTIGHWLARGTFFDEVSLDVGVVEAFGRACKSDDFVPWVTAKSREGWLVVQRDRDEKSLAKGGQGTVDLIRGLRSSTLVHCLKDPVASVIKLCDQDPVKSMTVFIEQCQLDESRITDTIMTTFGGWQEFSSSEIIGSTEEGFLFEAENPFTKECLLKLYESRGVAITEEREKERG
jgi:hypothetical protein